MKGPAKVKTVNDVQTLAHDEVQQSLARLELLAKVMDSAFVLPGTNVRMGLDAIIGIVPVVGDLISQTISSYLIWEAKRLGVSKLTLWRMIGNSAIDTVIGIVPLVGDAFDIAFRANMKNLALLKAHLEKHGHLRPAPATSGTGAGSGPVIEGTATRIG